MHIIVENHIPYIHGLLEDVAQVSYLPPEAIDATAVRDADALLVRTRTRCDASLLHGSRVNWIGTATIGTDHIDMDYCATHGIAVANAPGCNAPAVAQYVLAGIGHWMAARGITRPEALTLGVVGVGHVGSIVARWARQLGFDVLCCDPPRAEREGDGSFVTLDHLLAHSHIVTLHTPLTLEGPHATRHLIDASAIAHAPQCRLLINAARGPITSTTALLNWHGDLIIDCWENEPSLSTALLERTFIATPHIAGYSAQGKANASSIVVRAIAREFGLPLTEWYPAQVQRVERCDIGWEDMCQSISRYCDLTAQSAELRQQSSHFESLRNNYHYREEYF
jgi:erythronate-4-phosphate dehydrogenase